MKTPNLREAVKQTIYQWLKNGLFQTEYLRLCKSTGVDTVNKFKTKYPHNITIQNSGGGKNKGRRKS